MKNKGFTHIEILVVVAIIGILTAVADCTVKILEVFIKDNRL
jgi:prepilin-type N-terminal cleavage/methylation domain-containing protein